MARAAAMGLVAPPPEHYAWQDLTPFEADPNAPAVAAVGPFDLDALSQP